MTTESFSQLQHAHWNGFTPTDLVFPSFLFAVGNALSFAMKKWETMSQAAVVGKILKRTVIIFLIGFLLYWFPFVHMEGGHLVLNPISHTRILGVLQRIALCYGIGALLLYYCSTRTVVVISILLLLGYWVVLLALPGSGRRPFWDADECAVPVRYGGIGRWAYVSWGGERRGWV